MSMHFDASLVCYSRSGKTNTLAVGMGSTKEQVSDLKGLGSGVSRSYFLTTLHVPFVNRISSTPWFPCSYTPHRYFIQVQGQKGSGVSPTGR